MPVGIDKIRASSTCCNHIPLVEPARWCFRQISNISNLNDAAGTNRCARIASKVCLVFLAVVTLVPCLILAGIGLAFSCAFNKCAVSAPVVQKPAHILKPEKPKKPAPNIPKPISTKRPKPITVPAAPKTPKTSKINLTEFADEDLQFTHPSIAPDEVLLNKAMLFFADKKVKARKPLSLDFSSLGSQATDHQIIDAILKDHQGFNVGESHNHLSSKKFFLDNMAYLKSKNVRTIFFEGADFKDQNIIDQYLDGHWDENQKDIKKFKSKILDYSQTFKVPDHLSDWEVIKAAKQHGIRISLIDYSLEVSGPGRLLRMNYVAAKVMARDLKQFSPTDKFVGYVGWNHIAKVNNDPNFGLSELFQCPAVIVRDNDRSNDRSVIYHKIPSDNFIGNIHVVIFDKKP